jgi:tripartite-type tricarboxylate transporter receptor subunit TctC
MRRLLAPLAVALATLAAAGIAVAQSYPTRAVRIVVAYPPGGGIDVMGRQIAERLARQWGQPVVVENRPGGSTIPATELVAKAPADGHTILLTTDATFSINPHLFARLPYSDRDFAPVTQLILLQQMLVVHPSLPARSLGELVALAKEKPGTLNYASYGSGSQPHLAAEMLKAKAGIDIVHIPYKGITLAVAAVMAHEVEMTFSGIATGRPQIQAGRIRALAIGGPKRSPLVPDVPTFTELGYPEVETHAWFGLFVPAGTPGETVGRIHGDVVAVLNDPGFRGKEIAQKGYDLVASSPEQFAAYLVRDREARGRAVKVSGAKSE